MRSPGTAPPCGAKRTGKSPPRPRIGIAVSGAMRELTGVISDFPGERADGGEALTSPEDELASRRKFRDRKTG